MPFWRRSTLTKYFLCFVAVAPFTLLVVRRTNDPSDESKPMRLLEKLGLQLLGLRTRPPKVTRERNTTVFDIDRPVHPVDQSVLNRDFSEQHVKVVAKLRTLRRKRRPLTVWQELGYHRTLFVGVMTAKKYLQTRATAINNTWGPLVPKIQFFCPGEGSPEAKDLPVVSQPGVDDTYPPQIKSFSMLKYMHDQHLNDFDWFMRADDDLYLRFEKLLAFLRTLDAQKDIYMGQPGWGLKRDRARLKLEDGEVYCMGGTGVFYTRGALKKLRPYLDHCLNQVMSYHEDVEVGRCISRKAGLTCTWNYQMGEILYHDTTGKLFEGPDLPNDNKSVQIMQRAITLHPIKVHGMMYRVHAYYTKLKLSEIQKPVEDSNQAAAALV